MNPGRIKCPTCKRDVDWDGARFRPFCSERCRLVDLGGWFAGQRAIPGDSTAEHDAAGLEESSDKKEM